MSVQEYGLKFTHLSKYAPHMVANPSSQISKFLFGVSDLVKTEWSNAMLLEDLDISKIMNHAQQVEEDKLREMAKDSKKARIRNYEFFQ